MTYSISIRLSRVSGPYGGSCFTIFFFSHSLVKSIRFFFFSIRQKRLLSLNLCFFRFDRIQLNFFLSQNAVSIFYMNQKCAVVLHGTQCRYAVERPSSFFHRNFGFFFFFSLFLQRWILLEILVLGLLIYHFYVTFAVISFTVINHEIVIKEIFGLFTY